jgi:hypothetical protein
MTDGIETMRRRWVIEVHRPGEAVAHVTNGDRVVVLDDLDQACKTLDAMQGSLDPSTVVYKLAPHHCWCAVMPETAVGERDLARWARTELAEERDEARAQLAEVRYQLSEAVERNLSHLAVIKQVGAERDDLRDRLEDVDAGRVERGAQRDSALHEAERSQKRLRVVEDALREARAYESRLRAECNVLAAKLDLSREETAVIAKVGGIDREGYLSQYPIVAEREALDAALAAYEIARKSAPSPVDGPAVGSVRETYAPPRGQLYDASGVPCPDIEQHPYVVAAYKDRDAMRAERDAVREDLSGRIAELVKQANELRADVAKHVAALGLCDQWIQDRDKVIAGLRAELDVAGTQVLSIEKRLEDAEAVSRGLVDELRRGAERPRLLSALRRLGIPMFIDSHARASDEAEAHARASRLLGKLREAERERDGLRTEAEGLRAAALEAGLANYREERPALYAEVARLQVLCAELDAKHVARSDEVLRLEGVVASLEADRDGYFKAAGCDRGQLLWKALHEHDSTTTWGTTTADRALYARAEEHVRRWGHIRLKGEILELETRVAQLTDAGNRRPLMSEVEASLRAEIERLRGVVLERDAAAREAVGATTTAEASRH